MRREHAEECIKHISKWGVMDYHQFRHMTEDFNEEMKRSNGNWYVAGHGGCTIVKIKD